MVCSQPCAALRVSYRSGHAIQPLIVISDDVTVIFPRRGHIASYILQGVIAFSIRGRLN